MRHEQCAGNNKFIALKIIWEYKKEIFESVVVGVRKEK